jgi:hypothetical protein
VYIFVKTDQHFSQIDISQCCKEQNFKISAIQLVSKTTHLTLSLYRAQTGKVKEFLRRPDVTLKYLYNSKPEFIICGDININYLDESRKKQVNSLLRT